MGYTRFVLAILIVMIYTINPVGMMEPSAAERLVGYSADKSAWELEYEALLKAIPNHAVCQQHNRTLTVHPILVGSDWELAGNSAETPNYFSSWTLNPDSPILGLMQTTYQDLYGQDLQVRAVHVGLECEAVSGIYPDMDMIFIGSILAEVHTPDENLSITSVQKVEHLLTTVLHMISD